MEAEWLSGYPEEQLPTPRRTWGCVRHSISKTFHEEKFPHGCAEAENVAVDTRSRRSQWKAEATGLVNVNVAGQLHKVPRRLLKAARLGLVDLDRR